MVEFSYPAAFLKPGFDIKIVARSVEFKWAFQRPRGSCQGFARSPDRATGKFFLDDPSGKANRRKRLRSPHSGLANQERTQKPEHPQRRPDNRFDFQTVHALEHSQNARFTEIHHAGISKKTPAAKNCQ